MKSFRWLTASGSLALAAATFLGTAIALHGLWRVLFLSVAALLAIVAVGCLIYAPVRWRASRPRQPLGNVETRWVVSDREVELAMEFYAQRVPQEGQPDRERMAATLRRCRETVRVMERERRPGQMVLVGVLVIAPLTPVGSRLAESKQLRDLYDFDLQRDVCPNWNRARSAYIGAIAGDGRYRVDILQLCQAWLVEHKIRRVFARPGSSDGERVMRHNGFRPLGAPSKLWMCEATFDGSSAAPRRSR